MKQSVVNAFLCKKGRNVAEINKAIMCLTLYCESDTLRMDSRLCDHNLTFKKLMAAKPSIMNQLLTNVYPIQKLIKEAYVPFERFIALEPPIRCQLIERFDTIKLLTTEAQIPAETLIDLKPDMIYYLCENYHQIEMLMTEASIRCETLIDLKPAMIYCLYKNIYRIKSLIREAGIPVESLIALESEVLNQLIANYSRIIDLMAGAQHTHQYLIRNNIITTVQLAISLLDETPYPTIQHFVNEKLSAFGVLPEGYQLQAENIPDLIQLVKGVAEIRKNSRVFSQLTQGIFSRIPDDVKKTIAGFTGNDRADEIRIADRNYGQPPEPGHNF